MTTEQIEDPEGRELVDAIHERKRITDLGFTIETDPSLPLDEVWIKSGDRAVGWFRFNT